MLHQQVEHLPKRLNLGEFSQHKTQRHYVTTVVDLDHAGLVEVIDSHRQDDLITALTALYAVAESLVVEEVSIDLWAELHHRRANCVSAGHDCL